jgi:uncharacterized protein YfaS (alpha-2-macroglobulin family)
VGERLYDPGTRVRIEAFFEVAGERTDPTTVTLRVRRPNGSVTVYTTGQLTKVATGHYRLELTPAKTEFGRWVYRWEGTGACEAQIEGSFRVRQQVIA